MKKLFLLVMGLLLGFLFAEYLRRPKMKRLQALEVKAARRKEVNAFAAREWQKEVAAMPFEERMDYELWEARQRLDSWHPFSMEVDDEQLP